MAPLEATAYRAVAARSNYLGQDRADISFSAKEACRKMSSPSTLDEQRLKRIGRYLISVPRAVYLYTWRDEEEVRENKLCQEELGEDFGRHRTSGNQYHAGSESFGTGFDYEEFSSYMNQVGSEKHCTSEGDYRIGDEDKHAPTIMENLSGTICELLQIDSPNILPRQATRKMKKVEGEIGDEFGPLRVDVFSDSDWAGCRRTRRSAAGGALMIGGHLIKHWSSTRKKRCPQLW